MGPGRLKGHRMMGDEDLNLVKTSLTGRNLLALSHPFIC